MERRTQKIRLGYWEKLMLVYLYDSKVRYSEDKVWIQELTRVFMLFKVKPKYISFQLLRLQTKGLIKFVYQKYPPTGMFRKYVSLTPEGEGVAEEIYQSFS